MPGAVWDTENTEMKTAYPNTTVELWLQWERQIDKKKIINNQLCLHGIPCSSKNEWTKIILPALLHLKN